MSEERRANVKEIKAMIQVATLAIPRERESRDMYRKAAKNAPGELSKQLFERLAKDEEQHALKLKAIIKYLKEELDRLKD